MQINVHVFASLTDYFESEFALEIPDSSVASTVIKKMIELNPEGKELLAACRLAVKDELVDDDYKLEQNEQILILPPSSGG